jgi:hypothetical protein
MEKNANQNYENLNEDHIPTTDRTEKGVKEKTPVNTLSWLAKRIILLILYTLGIKEKRSCQLVEYIIRKTAVEYLI